MRLPKEVTNRSKLDQLDQMNHNQRLVDLVPYGLHENVHSVSGSNPTQMNTNDKRRSNTPLSPSFFDRKLAEFRTFRSILFICRHQKHA